MVREGIVLGHRISEKGIEVDKAKVDVMMQLQPPKTVKDIKSFLGHQAFIEDSSKTSPSWLGHSLDYCAKRQNSYLMKNV